MLGRAPVEVTDIEERVAGVTVRVVLPEIVPEVAAMVALPAEMVVAKPTLLTVATPGFNELQLTWLLMSKLAPSEYKPIASNF